MKQAGAEKKDLLLDFTAPTGASGVSVSRPKVFKRRSSARRRRRASSSWSSISQRCSKLSAQTKKQNQEWSERLGVQAFPRSSSPTSRASPTRRPDTSREALRSTCPPGGAAKTSGPGATRPWRRRKAATGAERPAFWTRRSRSSGAPPAGLRGAGQGDPRPRCGERCGLEEQVRGQAETRQVRGAIAEGNETHVVALGLSTRLQLNRQPDGATMSARRFPRRPFAGPPDRKATPVSSILRLFLISLSSLALPQAGSAGEEGWISLSTGRPSKAGGLQRARAPSGRGRP